MLGHLRVHPPGGVLRLIMLHQATGEYQSAESASERLGGFTVSLRLIV